MKKFLSFILSIATIAAICYGVYTYILPQDSHKEYKEDFGNNVENIVIGASLLQIKVKDGNSFAIEYDGAENVCPVCTYDEGSKTLNINQPEYKPKKKKISDENELTIYIPEGAKLTSFDLTDNIGDVSLGDLSADTIKLMIDLGSVKGDKIVTSKLSIEANLGDVDIEKCSCKDINIVSNMGNVELGITDDIKDYAISASSSLGEVKIGSDKHKKNYVQTGNAGSIMINCNLGNVEIN